MEAETPCCRLEKIVVLLQETDAIPQEIRSVGYFREEISFEVNPVRDMMLCKSACGSVSDADTYTFDIEPDDIDITDSFTVV